MFENKITKKKFGEFGKITDNVSKFLTKGSKNIFFLSNIKIQVKKALKKEQRLHGNCSYPSDPAI